MVRGPYERLKYDFRRLWECPECGHRTYGGGEQTSQTCDCGRKATPPRTIFMRLLAEGGRRTDIRPPGAPPPDQLAAPRKGEVLAREQSSPTMPAAELSPAPPGAVDDPQSTSTPSPPRAETSSPVTSSTEPTAAPFDKASHPPEAPPANTEAAEPPADAATNPASDAGAAGESAESTRKQKGRRRGKRSKSKRRRKGGQ